MFWKSVPAFPRLVYVAGRLQLEEPGEQCGKHTPSAPEEVQQQHLSKFHVDFSICGCLRPKECGCFMPVGAFWREVVSWILIAWRWERSAKRNWIRALWTWWLSSFLDCTSFGCFEYCGLCMVFVWDSRNHGVFVTLKWGSGFSKRTAQRRGFGIRFIYHLKWGWLLQTFETKTCWRSQIQMEILPVFGSLSADLPWAHRPFTRFTCHHKSPLALPGRLEWKRRRLERGRGGAVVGWPIRSNVVE